MDDETRQHIERVREWLDENVRVYPTPREATLSAFEFDWNSLAGSFQVSLDRDVLPERLRFGLEISGWLYFYLPLFISPLGAPASYPAVEFTEETRRAITEGLHATLPRMLGYGIVRENGKEIGALTPLSERIVDRARFESAKVKASAAGYSITVTTQSDTTP